MRTKTRWTMAAAVRRILSEPGLAGGMVGASSTSTLSWPAVAERYETLANRLLAARRYTAEALPS